MKIDINIEKLSYFLNSMEPEIESLIDRVINDSDEDPQYSAVTATNLVKIYIELSIEMGESLPFNDLESFFKFNGYTKEEYSLFETKRKKEAEYYIGVQY